MRTRTMANNVVGQALGGEKTVHDNVRTVKDVCERMKLVGYTATVNGDQQAPDYALEDGDFVSLSQAVKGG